MLHSRDLLQDKALFHRNEFIVTRICKPQMQQSNEKLVLLVVVVAALG